ncbi:pupal cuticle protein 36-like [Penaeus vannamei]|uniref:pupal cuticle protein 36-like n=1 Tax=Penaeus vannamei TaxID=6689 RepID=UPI00387F4FED
MKFLILACTLASAAAALQGYSLPQASGSAQSTGSEFVGISGHVSGGGFSTTASGGISSGFGHVGGSGFSTGAGQVGIGHIASGISTPAGQVIVSGNAADVGHLAGAGAGITEACVEGQVRHVDGSCIEPVVNRRVYVFDVPEQPQHTGPLPTLPPPRVDHNILFVRLPEDGEGPEPIVVPPPRQENIVYVLNKKDDQTQRVIEVPAHPPKAPEIYFVNYEDGDNPTLPSGVDLHTALGTASTADGQVLGVSGGAGLSGGFSGETGGAATAGTNGFGIVGSGGVDGTVISNTGSGVNFQVSSGVAGFQAGAVIGNAPFGLYSTP